MKKILLSALAITLISENLRAQPKKYYIRVELEEKLKGAERTDFYKQHRQIPLTYVIYNKEKPPRWKSVELDVNKHFSTVIEDFFLENDDYLTIEIDLLKKGPPYFFSGRGTMLNPIWANSPDTIWINAERADEVQFDRNKNIYYNKQNYRLKCWPLKEAIEYAKIGLNGGEKGQLTSTLLRNSSNKKRFDRFIQYVLDEKLTESNPASIFNIGLYLANRALIVNSADSSLQVLSKINDKINIADLAIDNQKAFFKDAMYYLYLANNFNKKMSIIAKKTFDDFIVDSISANPVQKDFFSEVANAYYNSDLIKKDKPKFPVEKTDRENVQIQFCLIGKGIGKEINCSY